MKKDNKTEIKKWSFTAIIIVRVRVIERNENSKQSFEGRKTVELTVVVQRDDKTSITKRVQCFRLAYMISFCLVMEKYFEM